MEPILLLSAIVTFSIFLTISISLLKEIKTSSFNKREIPLVILALTYLIFTISLFLWAINLFIFSSLDFIVVFSVLLTVQTLCLLFIIYKTKQDKKIFYYTVPLALLVLLAFFIPRAIHLIIPLSLITTLLVFLITSSIHEKPTRYLILYVSTSILFYLFAVLWSNLITILSLASGAFFLAFIISFLKFLQSNPQQNFPPAKEPESPLVHFLKHFVFIIIMTNFIFIGTVSVHEFGHLLSSSQSGCEEAKIVYELRGLPHTEVSCEDVSQQNKWILGGILLPFIVAIFFIFCGGKFIKELALQIIGFNLILSYIDLTSLKTSEAIATIGIIAGVSLILFSLALLAKSRIE